MKHRSQLVSGMGTGLLIRADASAATGLGHVLRCLALAQNWMDVGGRVFFLKNAGGESLERRLREEGCHLLSLDAPPGGIDDAHITASVAEDLEVSWIVLDGYEFGDHYQGSLRSRGLRVVAVDDYGHAVVWPADVVLNQNVNAREELYLRRDARARLLLGPMYALLRREFTGRVRTPRDVPKTAHRLLITAGGSDPSDLTSLAMSALELSDDLGWEAVCLAGPTNPRYEHLVARARAMAFQIRVEKAATNIAPLMEWADLAISASGSTCYESAFLGLPALIVPVADNQTGIAAGLDAAGIGESMGPARSLTAELSRHQPDRLAHAQER